MYLIFLMTDRANAREPMKSLISWACTVDKINRGLIFMNKKKFTYITALTLLSFTLMTGGTSELKENQTAYRQIGINAMESGDYAGAVDAFNSALGQCIGKITENFKKSLHNCLINGDGCKLFINYYICRWSH